MKIINILLTSKLGGVEQAFLDYNKSLGRLGHEMIAITKFDAPYAQSLQDMNVPTINVDNKFGYMDYPLIWKIRRILKKEKPDIVIAHAGRAISLMKRASKGICPIVGINHSCNVKRSIGCDAVFVVNSRLLKRVIEAGQSEDAAFLIPNMIDLDEESFNEPPPSNIIGNSLVTIGTLGRFSKEKGFDYLIRAIAILNSRGIDVRAVMAGRGDEEDTLKELVSELKIVDRVFFPGWISNKEWLFNSMDIFCLPSLEESFGIVLLEAMRFGKVIVATDCYGPTDILEDKKDALIVSRENPEKLAENLANTFEKLINNPGLREKLANNALEKVRNKYCIKFSGKRLENILQGVIDKKKTGTQK